MINIGIAVESDIEGIAVLEKKTFTDAWSSRSIAESVSRDHITVIAARDGACIVGYIICYHIMNEGEIMRVAVSEEYRRRSVASHMLGFLIMEGGASGLATYSLEVRAGNAPAISLYERFKFSREGHRAGYYRNPEEDALIMRRRALNDENNFTELRNFYA